MAIYFQKNNQVKASTRNTSTDVSNVSNTEKPTTLIDLPYGQDKYIFGNLQFTGIFSNGRKQYKRISLNN